MMRPWSPTVPYYDFDNGEKKKPEKYPMLLRAVNLTEYQQALVQAIKASDHAQVERLIEIRG